jgi:hypothetical protein
MTTILSDPGVSSAPRSVQPGGFKVDISRGERIGRVSSEWFSRPNDERYPTRPYCGSSALLTRFPNSTIVARCAV